MATSDTKITEGAGKNIATYSFVEDSETKEAQRIALTDSSGYEIGYSGRPVATYITGTNTVAATFSGSMAVYFDPSEPTIKGITNRIDVQRVQNVVDGTITTVVRADRVMNLVDGTISTIPRVDRVFNLVNGTISAGTLDYVTRIRNIIDGTISLVSAVTNITNTVAIKASDGTFAVYFNPTQPTVKVMTGSTIAVSLDPGHTLGNVLVTNAPTITGITNSIAVVPFTPAGSQITDEGFDAQRVLIAGSHASASLEIKGTLTGITNTVNVSLDPGHTIGNLGSINNITTTVTIKTDPGYELGSIKGINSSIAVYFQGSNPKVNLGTDMVNTGSTASIFTVSGSVSGSYPSGKTLVAPSASYNFKVFAIALTTTAQVQNVVQLHNGGEAETEFWRYALQAPTAGIAGANLAVSPPSYIFATGTSTTLAIQADASSLIHYSISFIKESA